MRELTNHTYSFISSHLISFLNGQCGRVSINWSKWTKPSTQHVPLDEYKQNLKDIIEYIQQCYNKDKISLSSTVIILITPPPFDIVSWNEYCKSTNNLLGLDRGNNQVSLWFSHSLTRSLIFTLILSFQLMYFKIVWDSFVIDFFWMKITESYAIACVEVAVSMNIGNIINPHTIISSLIYYNLFSLIWFLSLF